MKKLLHVCEKCGKTEWLTPDEAYEQGWDYPPNIGMFGVLSPRTCGDCDVVDTVWWKITCAHVTPDDLTDKEKATITRILNEPESIMR